MKKYLSYLALIMLLTGCQVGFLAPRQTATAIQSTAEDLAPSPTPSLTPSPTQTPTPTLTPTPTPTPTPTLYALDGTPIPASIAVINASNSAQVSALAEWQVGSVSDVAWTPDGAELAVSTDKQIELYDVFTRNKLRTLFPQSTDLVSIAFNSDFFGTWLAAGSRRGSEQEGFGSAIELWRGPDWQPRGILSGSTRGLNQVTFSPDGKVLAAVYSSPIERDNLIEFLDTTRWTISSTLQAGSVLDISFSPDSVFVATSPDRYAVKVWEANKQNLAYKFYTSFTDAVQTMAYSPDGTVLATGDYGGRIIFWDMKTGTIIRSFQSDSAIASLAFSPDGRVLASGSVFQDNLIRLWSADTGELLRELEGNTQGVDNLLFSPDGRLLVSGSYDGRVILWGIRP